MGMPRRLASAPQAPGQSRGKTGLRLAGIALLVAGLACAALWPVTGNGFVNYDDDLYLTDNAQVRRGLSLDGMRWAATTFHASNWHPLTWLSHMLDVEFFGLDSGRHHLAGLALHALNAALLFLVLAAATGSATASAVTAALFAVHPLHVESVAWAAERKDLLSTLFGLLAIGAYVASRRRPSRPRSLAVALLLAAGLTAKPMLVTLPALLLLLDFWPLGRFATPYARFDLRLLRPLVLEKLPLFALSAVAAAVTLVAQRQGTEAAGVATFSAIPLGVRAGNALLGYVWYLRKAIWPSGLAVLYPHALAMPPAPQTAAAVAILAAIGIACAVTWRRRPELTFGWLWYLVTLLPVAGLVQVGLQSTADRYSYITLVGPFFAAAGVLAPRGRPRRIPGLIGVGCVALALLALALAANRQTRAWKDGVTLFSQAVARTRDNWLAYNNLGTALLDAGRSGEAIEALRQTTRLVPYWAPGRYNLGLAYAHGGRHREAAAEFRASLELQPGSAAAHHNLANCLVLLGRVDEALAEYRSAARFDPGLAAAHLGAAVLLARRGQREEAVRELRETLRLQPDAPRASALLEALTRPSATTQISNIATDIPPASRVSGPDHAVR